MWRDQASPGQPSAKSRDGNQEDPVREQFLCVQLTAVHAMFSSQRMRETNKKYGQDTCLLPLVCVHFIVQVAHSRT